MLDNEFHYINYQKRLYQDVRAPDGVLASGWRRVRQGGLIKFGKAYYYHEDLEGLEGELIHVYMVDCEMLHAWVERGVFGCSFHFCVARMK